MNRDIRIDLTSDNWAQQLNNQILSKIGSSCTELSILYDNVENFDFKTFRTGNIVFCAGVIDYYKNINLTFHCEICEKMDFKLENFGVNRCFSLFAMDTAFSLYSFKENPFDIVWKFTTADEVNALVTNFISFIRETDQIEKGVLNSIEIGINEIMDNVLQHSQAPGFIMGHLQKDEKKLSITIFDCGIGIYNSLKGSKHNPSSPLDAITLAMQERVTRDEKIGQGNGMWIMSSLVNENKGSIRISSCGAAYSSVKNEVNTSKEGDFYFDGKHGTTAVEFELDYSKPIDVTKALKGYTPTDLWLENRELDNGDYKIIVADEAEGTGTRKSAYKMKNKILNIYKETGKKIILDFSGVNVMSFSFADELLGKIISEYGFVFFTETFKLVNLSDINIQILNRSVEQRMAQNYYAEPVDCNE